MTMTDGAEFERGEVLKEPPTTQEWVLEIYGYGSLTMKKVGDNPHTGAPVLGRDFTDLYRSPDAARHTLQEMEDLRLVVDGMSAEEIIAMIEPYRPLIESRLGPRPTGEA